MKLVVSCCAYWKLLRDFCFSVPSIIFNANHNVTCPSSLDENDHRLLKNSEGNDDGERIFLLKEGGRRCFILTSEKNKKYYKNLQSNLN